MFRNREKKTANKTLLRIIGLVVPAVVLLGTILLPEKLQALIYIVFAFISVMAGISMLTYFLYKEDSYGFALLWGSGIMVLIILLLCIFEIAEKVIF